MLNKNDWELIQKARDLGCEIPALSKEPPEHWLAVAKEFLYKAQPTRRFVVMKNEKPTPPRR
jgi:hypothetical protein